MTTKKKNTPYEVEPERTENATTQPEPTNPRPTLVPRADIYETADAVHLVADMPGVDERSVEVTLEKNVLTISGRVTPPGAPQGWQRVYSELADGDWKRSFQLSNEADTQSIRATVKNGVLRLSVPKRQPAHRKIEVLAE
jgi:HSP20 family protein